MGDLIDLFTGEPIPAAEESDFVSEFVENELGDFLSSVQSLRESADEAEFRKWMGDIRAKVNGWPR